MKLKTILLASSLCAMNLSASAVELDIKITNLTGGLYFTPLLITSHTADDHLFQLGTTASSQLQAMAEGGDISGLVEVAESIAANSLQNPAAGLLGPTLSAEGSLDTGDNTVLSLTAMILPSNDGFVGLDSWVIPSVPGVYEIYLNAYDAGTEANNELIVEGSGAPGNLGIPAAPGEGAGTDGSGVIDAEINTNIHIHPGTLGDTDSQSGNSDLDSRIHRWLNPVAKLTVTVK